MQIVGTTLRLSLLLLILFAFTPLNAAQSKVFEGDALPEPLRIELDFNGADYALVTASQKSADYILSLKSGASQKELKKVNISAGKFLDEVLFLKAGSCVKCAVVLTGKELVDKSSPYRLAIEYFSKAEIDRENNTKLKALLEAITRAGEFEARINFADMEQTKELRSQAVAELKSVVGHQSVTSDLHWKLHSKTLLLQLLGELRQREGAKELAESVIIEADQSYAEFSVRAFYDLAALNLDAIEKDKFFRQGMSVASEVGAHQLYAYGANRLAISLVGQAQFDEALGFFSDAQDLFRSEENFRSLIEPLGNLSWANYRAGDQPKAIAYAASHKLFAENYKVEDHVVWALYRMALAYGEMGERYKADIFLDQALEAHNKLSDELKIATSSLYGSLLQERAESLLRLGDLESAADYVSQMREYFLDRKNFARVANAGFVEGRIALAQNHHKLARKLIKDSIAFEEINSGFRNAALRYLRLVELEIREREFIQAASYQVSALNLLAKTQDRALQASAFSQSIELLVLMGHIDRAKQLADRLQGFIDEHGLVRDHAKFAYRVALVESKLENYESALTYLAKARSMIDSALPKLRRRDLRQHYFALQKSVFELNVKALISTNQPKKALSIVESYKARTLREIISQVGLAGQSQELVDARNRLYMQILGNAADWYQDGNIDNRGVLRRARRLSSELEKTEAEFMALHDLADSQVAVSLEFPGITHSSELVAYYFVGENDSWLWLISSQGVSVSRLPPEDELVELIAGVKEQVSTHPSNRVGLSAWKQKQQLRELSKILLAPMEKYLLAGNVVNLTIVSDGPLDGLPFAPLLVDGIDGPLITQVAISHIPSNESRKALEKRARTRKSASQPQVLVVADPVSAAANSDRIDRLPYSVSEATMIEAKFAGRATVVSAESATKENIIPMLSRGYSILHFATHGLLNNSEPALSGLLFSKLSDAPNFWLAPEISRSNFDANLVVLSACESSVGRGIPGEGMFSLSRAFIEGGASHVVGSLWKVEDASTADLMSHFYSSLLDDSLVVSLALQRAQIATYSNKNNDWRDPYFWAGFQLQGGWNTLAYERNKGT